MQFALASIIEAIRRNPDKYNNLLFNDISASSTMATNPSLLSYIEDYNDMIPDESNSLYDSILKHFTNSITDNALLLLR